MKIAKQRVMIELTEEALNSLKLESVVNNIASRKEHIENIVNEYTNKLKLKVAEAEEENRIKIMIELSPEIANKLMVQGAKIGLVKKKYCEKVLTEIANK